MKEELKAGLGIQFLLAAGQGLEPRSPVPKTGVTTITPPRTGADGRTRTDKFHRNIRF